MSVERRWREVTARVARAAESAGRDPTAVRIIGVTKTVGREAVDAAYTAGARDFGENRVQDALRKFTPPLPGDARLHLIGSLQSNKARDAVALFDVIHSVDRPSLVTALEHRAAGASKKLRVLIQVNVAREAQKHGCQPEDAEALARAAAAAPHLQVVGLMTIAPLVASPEDARPIFRGLRELRDAIATAHPTLPLAELSMGMTNDFEIAVQEGATMVRIGRAIFAPGPV